MVEWSPYWTQNNCFSPVVSPSLLPEGGVFTLWPSVWVAQLLPLLVCCWMNVESVIVMRSSTGSRSGVTAKLSPLAGTLLSDWLSVLSDRLLTNLSWGCDVLLSLFLPVSSVGLPGFLNLVCRIWYCCVCLGVLWELCSSTGFIKLSQNWRSPLEWRAM